MPKDSPRPHDPNHLAKPIVDIASGEVKDARREPKDAAAVKLGRKGGKARAEKISPERRAEIARNAAKLRWAASVKPD